MYMLTRQPLMSLLIGAGIHPFAEFDTEDAARAEAPNHTGTFWLVKTGGIAPVQAIRYYDNKETK